MQSWRLRQCVHLLRYDSVRSEHVKFCAINTVIVLAVLSKNQLIATAEACSTSDVIRSNSQVTVTHRGWCTDHVDATSPSHQQSLSLVHSSQLIPLIVAAAISMEALKTDAAVRIQ